MVDGKGSGKVAIVTGCASGMGLETTRLFLSHQYKVLGVDVSEMDHALLDKENQEMVCVYWLKLLDAILFFRGVELVGKYRILTYGFE